MADAMRQQEQPTGRDARRTGGQPVAGPRLGLALLLGLGTAVGLPALPSLAPQPAAAQQALPPAVGRPLQAASQAARARNFQAANNAVAQARAAASTPAERRAVAQMAAYVHTQSGNFAAAARELEAIGAPASQLAPLHYRARNFERAIELAQRSGQTTIVAQSYLMMGRPADAARVYQQLVERNPNNVNYLTNLAGAQFRAGDREAYMRTTTRLIQLDPTPQRWRALLADMRRERLSPSATLALYQLMAQTGNLNDARDVEEFAKYAISRGQPHAAQTVLQRAIQDGVMPAAEGQRLLQAAQTRAQQAAQRAPQQMQDPAQAYEAGNTFLGMGRFPQAIQAYQVALRGPDADAARTFLGVAQLRGGNRQAAAQTFASVPDGNMKDVANLWALYARTARG